MAGSGTWPPQAFEAGWVFAAWVLSAHRASQELDYSVRLAVEPAFVLTPATLRGVGAVPPGLPANTGRDASFVVGIMDDGRGALAACRTEAHCAARPVDMMEKPLRALPVSSRAQ